MKKILLIIIFLVSGAMNLSADRGEKSIGGQIMYGSYKSQLGIGVNYQVEIFNKFRLAPSVDFFVKHKDWSTVGLNFNAQYLFEFTEGLKVYPLVGVNYSFWFNSLKNNTYYMDDRLGCNLGIGAEIDLSQRVALTAELKGLFLKDFSQLIVGMGMQYKF